MDIHDVVAELHALVDDQMLAMKGKLPSDAAHQYGLGAKRILSAC